MVTIALSDVWAAIGVLAMLLGVWWRLQQQITANARRIDKKVCYRELEQLRQELSEKFVQRHELTRELDVLRQLLQETRNDIRDLQKSFREALRELVAKQD